MNFEAFHITAQGASHIKKNRECQDASKSFCCKDYSIAVVCDGHGGDDYIRSAVGSEKASQIAIDNIKEFITHVNEENLKRHFDEFIRPLQSSIISMWQSEIRNHWESNPITEEEKSRLSEKAKKRYFINNNINSAYGTTLLAVAMTENYWFCFQVGDGRCVWIDQNSNFAQLKLDDKCFLNATTSLCDSDALEHFHSHYSEDIPVAVFVGSDGIDDCFKNDTQLYNFYKTISYSFGTTQTEQAVEELKDFLPRLSQKGSGDDVSIAAVMNMDLLPNIDAVTAFNREDERAKKQKAEEEEAKKNAELREAYQRKAEEASKKNEDYKHKSEGELLQKDEREQALDDERRMREVVERLETARKIFNDAENNLENAKKEKNIYLQKLQESASNTSNVDVQTNYDELYVRYQEKDKIYRDCNFRYQYALSNFEQAKLEYSRVFGRSTIKCPKCNELNFASNKYCINCGCYLKATSSEFETQECLISEEKDTVVNLENYDVKESDEKETNIKDNIINELDNNSSSQLSEYVDVKENESAPTDQDCRNTNYENDTGKVTVDEAKNKVAETDIEKQEIFEDE